MDKGTTGGPWKYSIEIKPLHLTNQLQEVRLQQRVVIVCSSFKKRHTCSDVDDWAGDDADDVGGDALVQRRVDPGQVLVGREGPEEDGAVVSGHRQQLEHLLDGVEGELVLTEAPFDSLKKIYTNCFALVVAQLVERLLPTPEIRSSNPD